MELTSVCIDSTLDVYRNHFACVSTRLRFVSKQLGIETTVKLLPVGIKITNGSACKLFHKAKTNVITLV